MNRRNFCISLGIGLTGVGGCMLRLDEGLWNPCLPAASIPDNLSTHELVQAAWEGINPGQMWDCHTHLVGVGDGGTGIWVNPNMQTLKHPVQKAQMKFFLNAGCAEKEGQVDQQYLNRLMNLQNGLARGVKLILLAFDYNYSDSGERLLPLSSFYTPNSYAGKIAKKYPEKFEWISSIHPYRKDCVKAMEAVVKGGARAVKWLPPAMGINPASPLCDRFYDALSRLNIPLLTHGGKERAVHGSDNQSFGNPLLLRRALDHGVRVIVAHCASMGTGTDIDKGIHGPQVDNFELFVRLMNEPRYEQLLFGDISAMTQSNRVGIALDTVVDRTDWHSRLLNGSDYPLPAVMPLYSMDLLVKKGYIRSSEAVILSKIRRYNPLLFDFVLKRHLKVEGGKRFSHEVFHTRRFFEK